MLPFSYDSEEMEGILEAGVRSFWICMGRLDCGCALVVEGEREYYPFYLLL